MQVVSIGTARHADQILERLNYEFRTLQEEGIDIDVHQTNRGNLTFLGCKLVRGKKDRFSSDDSATILRHFVANALSDVIVNDWEAGLIRKIINEDYRHFPKEEREGVLEFVRRNLEGHLSDEKDLFHKVDRKRRVLARLVDYLSKHSEVVLEGFVMFRLKDYVEEIHECVSKAVDDYLMEKEYREFIRLLRYFVEAQEPRFDEIHAVITQGGSFRLSDRDGKPVAREYLDDLVMEIRQSEGDCEDLLISSLITLAPRSITLHLPPGMDETPGVQTIRKIFGERVSVCRGCDRCRDLREAGDSTDPQT